MVDSAFEARLRAHAEAREGERQRPVDMHEVLAYEACDGDWERSQEMAAASRELCRRRKVEHAKEES